MVALPWLDAGTTPEPLLATGFHEGNGPTSSHEPFNVSNLATHDGGEMARDLLFNAMGGDWRVEGFSAVST